MTNKRYKHVETVGKASVTDETGFAWQCEKCGEVDLTTSDLAGYERRAAAIVLRDGRHVGGSTMRYARKALGLKQTDLALLLGHTAEWVSKHENSRDDIPAAERLALVALIDGVENGTDDPAARVAQLTDGESNRPSVRNFEVRERVQRTG